MKKGIHPQYRPVIFFDAAAMLVTFVLFGHWMEMKSRKGTSESLRALLDLVPPTATVVRDGREVEVPTAEIVVADVVVLRPGELVTWDTARRGGFTTLGRVDNQTLILPRTHLAMVAPGYEAMIGRPFPAAHPAARLMGSFLGSLTPVISSLDLAARDAVADAALDIARAVVATRDDPQPRQQTAARLMAVRLYIDANLTNPSLSPATIAKANAISLRTLHRLFESTDDSVAAFVRERRLSRCHADLLRGTEESVSAIAFRWGFRNMSFFSRLFHERYGVSARELLVSARAAARPWTG